MKLLSYPVVACALLSIPAFAGNADPRGIPNFHQVNEHLFRGGQPTSDGWQSLAGMGVKTVIDLRRVDEHSVADEAKAVKAAGMQYVNVPMNGIVAPRPEDITKVLALLNSKDPVFVHCKRGADRTGTVVACYRMAHDRWDWQRSLAEAKSYGMSIFEVGMKSYIKSYQAPQGYADLTLDPAAAVAR